MANISTHRPVAALYGSGGYDDPMTLMRVVFVMMCWSALSQAHAQAVAAAAPPVVLAAESSSPQPIKCWMGKPSYCFKYGGDRCHQSNSRSE